MMFRHFEFKANDGTMVIDGRNLVMAVKWPTGESFGNKADLTDETEVMYIGNRGGGGMNSKYFQKSIIFEEIMKDLKINKNQFH